MSDGNSSYLGKKYACPGCQSQLKFRRPPTSRLHTCPNCRKKLRLLDKMAESKDKELKDAIESLMHWKAPVDNVYDYRKDPLLDRADESVPGLWVFDQPWPAHTKDVVIKEAEVMFNPDDIKGVVESRRLMMSGKYRRVTVLRTGEVEEMKVSGHWWDYEHHEAKVGVLSRATVRELNRLTWAKTFAVRIARVKQVTHEDRELLALYVDVAVQETRESCS